MKKVKLGLCYLILIVVAVTLLVLAVQRTNHLFIIFGLGIAILIIVGLILLAREDLKIVTEFQSLTNVMSICENTYGVSVLIHRLLLFYASKNKTFEMYHGMDYKKLYSVRIADSRIISTPRDPSYPGILNEDLT